MGPCGLVVWSIVLRVDGDSPAPWVGDEGGGGRALPTGEAGGEAGAGFG
jgi:hypothetical protein